MLSCMGKCSGLVEARNDIFEDPVSNDTCFRTAMLIVICRVIARSMTLNEKYDVIKGAGFTVHRSGLSTVNQGSCEVLHTCQNTPSSVTIVSPCRDEKRK